MKLVHKISHLILVVVSLVVTAKHTTADENTWLGLGVRGENIYNAPVTHCFNTPIYFYAGISKSQNNAQGKLVDEIDQ
ncbi:hypothetical protein EB093_01925 [bacterium]|nr:hypothetical protein [bacterium]